MSYNKKVWKSGDRITKEALNNMENGIEAAHQNSGGTGSVAIVDNLNSDSSTSALSAKQGKHMCVLKSRRKGYSYKNGSMACRNYYLLPGTKTYIYASNK